MDPTQHQGHQQHESQHQQHRSVDTTLPDDDAAGPDEAAALGFPDLEQVPLALRDRLAGSAEAEGLVDVEYRILDSPFGGLLVAATTVGVVRVAFATEDHDRVLGELVASISPRILRAPGRTDVVARQLNEYFEYRRQYFEVALDLQLVHGFRRQIVSRLPEIAYGTTESYGRVAERAGNPGAARAVGSACSHNPLPLVLPCHRVVRSDGSIGQYLGGVEVKRALLELESAEGR